MISAVSLSRSDIVPSSDDTVSESVSRGQRPRLAPELLPESRHVVVFRHRAVRFLRVDVGIHQGVPHHPRPEPGPRREEMQQQRVAGNVVGEAERDVAAPLVRCRLSRGSPAASYCTLKTKAK